VKGVRFQGLRDVGDPVELGAAYSDAGADELVYLDVKATLEGRTALLALVARIADRLAIPFTVGGGVRSRAGSSATGRLAVDWACEAEEHGAGEILLTSIDADGTREGYDLELTRAVTAAVSVPVIASGGAGSARDVADALDVTQAALLASILHENPARLESLRAELLELGVTLRDAA
jgi:cyclase